MSKLAKFPYPIPIHRDIASWSSTDTPHKLRRKGTIRGFGINTSLRKHVSIRSSFFRKAVDVGSPQNVHELSALINDATDTLIALSYVNPAIRIAVIFGTGSDAAYMERVGDIHHKTKNLGIDDEASNGYQLRMGMYFLGTLTLRRP